MITIPQSQAIRFIPQGEENFNTENGCNCAGEQWSYKVFPEDQICFQVKYDCEQGDNVILNESFEEGDGAEDFTDWTRSVANEEATNLTRNNDNPYCGLYSAEWENADSGVPTAATLTQTYSDGFVTGNTYVLTFRAKAIFFPSITQELSESILVITVGGLVFEFTLTSEWAEYTVVVTFNTDPADNNIILAINTTNSTNAQLMTVDCLDLGLLSGCCVIDLINNGEFELGQRAGDSIDPTFDNWVIEDPDYLTESLTGGLNGTRCVNFLLINTENSITQENVFGVGDYIVKFWAYDPVGVENFIVETDVQEIFNQAIATDWTEYTIRFTSTTDTDLKFLAQDQDLFLDRVSVFRVPETTVEIIDKENPENIILVSEEDKVPFSGGVNVCIPVDNYSLPECFNICFTGCVDNLVTNGNFEQGTGNLFTGWTLTQPSRTNLCLYYNQLDNAAWTKANLTVTANSTLAPDGSNSADTLTEDAVNSSFHADSATATVVNGTNYTMSAYVKSNGRRYVLLYEGFSDIGTFFDLQTGTVLGNLGAGTFVAANVKTAANGYYRISVTYTQTGTSASLQMYLSNNGTGVAYNGDGTSGIIVWGTQLEAGVLVTPVIATGAAPVTTSLGEIIQDATGGIEGSRCALTWFSGAGTSLDQSITLAANTQYVVRLWAKNTDTDLYQEGVAVLKVQLDGVVQTGTLTDTYQLFEFEFTTDGTPDNLLRIYNEASNSYGFMSVDNVQLFLADDYSVSCSEDFTFSETVPTDTCYKELVWYDNSDRTDVFGIDYTSGFVNRMNIEARLLNASYIKELSYELDGTDTQINSYTLRKFWDLTFEQIPEYIWDRIATMAGVSNIELGTVLLATNDESGEPTISWDLVSKSRLASGSMKISPKGEKIAERSINC